MTFDHLKLPDPLARAVLESGYTHPTPIQVAAIPHIRAGKDVLGFAQTGTGKTAAFALPILERLLNAAGDTGFRAPGARALVLSPTRELAQQVHENFVKYAKHTTLKCAAIVGGVHQYSQVQALKSGVDVLIATPGRLMDLMTQRLARVTLVDIVVLDEADRMLDIGFLPAIRRIMAHIPEDRQTLLFSATMPPAIRDLAKEILRNPANVQVTPVSSVVATVDHFVHFVSPEGKADLLARLLRESGDDRTLVFTRTKRGADKLVRHLRKVGVLAAPMHSDMEMSARTRALANFRSAHVPVLVATDIAARGLHVDDIARVINFDLTHEPETYVHRVGRTGRAGASGVAISFCTAAERRELRAIERLIGEPLQRASGEPPPDAAPAASGGGRAPASGGRRGRRGGRGRRGFSSRPGEQRRAEATPAG
ncbi:MAG: DEAD/DEAH box helicase [Phycisphaerae bacterium]